VPHSRELHKWFTRKEVTLMWYVIQIGNRKSRALRFCVNSDSLWEKGCARNFRLHRTTIFPLMSEQRIPIAALELTPLLLGVTVQTCKSTFVGSPSSESQIHD
jgi:hypothetical protein